MALSMVTRNQSQQMIVLLWTLILMFIAQLYAQESVDESQIEALNPGLKVRLSQPGLNYGASVAVDVLATKVSTIRIPDQSGSDKVPVVGRVEYTVSNIKVTKFVKPSTSVVAKPGSGLTWTLSNAGISIQGDWRVKYGRLIPIRARGRFEGHVSGASVTVSVVLGATSSGQATIRSTRCSCTISGIKIKLHGGFSWFYNLFMSKVERGMRSHLQNLVCKEARETIDVKAAAVLATLKTRVQIGKQLILDYGLVSNPIFSASYFETFHRGEFFFVGDTSGAPFQPSPLPSPPSAPRMVTFLISDYVFNTVAYVMHKHGALHRLVTKKDLPPANSTLLDLACCPQCTCIGKLLPAAARLYPNASVEIDLWSSERPLAAIGTSGIEITFVGTSVLNARLPNGTSVYMLKLKVEVNTTATPSFDGTTMRFSIKTMTANISVIDSAIGPVSAYLLNVIVQFVLNKNVIPALNEAGARGIPLPRINFIQLINAGLELKKNAISVSANIKYIGGNDDGGSTNSNGPISSLIFDPIGNHDGDLEYDEILK